MRAVVRHVGGAHLAFMQQLESIDLRTVSRSLAEAFRHHAPHGYLRGKTAMRDHLEEELGCSALEAEELVDTLESRGFLRFESSPLARSEADSTWAIDWNRRE